MSVDLFSVHYPKLHATERNIEFTYSLGDHSFSEIISFSDTSANFEKLSDDAGRHLLSLTAAVLGVSYYKLLAPKQIILDELYLAKSDHAFLMDIYENGLAEFYARNDLKRYGLITFHYNPHDISHAPITLSNKKLVLIGGGKDSLVSVDLLKRAHESFTLFAVNPKGPILSTSDATGEDHIWVKRKLDPEMIRLGKVDGYFNGHVPSTAINSMIAALACLLLDYDTIVLSNERSASEGNISFDGREANHQHSKSANFELLIAETLTNASGGALKYYSLLRQFSEAKIAKLFARTHAYDPYFSSCNENFKQNVNSGALWCCNCPKCRFVFLILAPSMSPDRLVDIFGENILGHTRHTEAYRELSGLTGHKPWECVGEILEAAACIYALSKTDEWQHATVVNTLTPELIAFYGEPHLIRAFEELFEDDENLNIPADLIKKLAPHV